MTAVLLLFPGCGTVELDAFNFSAAALNSNGSWSCAPGLTLCKHQCFDLANDPDHCGSCTTRCASSAPCVDGECGTKLAAPLTMSISVVQLSGGQATDCVRSDEGYPERSTNSGTASLYLGYQSQGAGLPLYNWSANGSSWSASYLGYPWLSGGNPGGDPWATTSGNTGLEYISEVFYPYSDGRGCIGVAATSATSMANGSWTFPMNCLNTPGSNYFDDGPSIHYDLGSSTLWAAARKMNNTDHWLYIMANCAAGAPGVSGSQCPITSSINCGPNAGGHPTVTVNPCTHDGIVAYQDNANPQNIWLKFYRTDGQHQGSFFLATVAWGEADGCRVGQPCAGGGPIPICGGACSGCSQAGQGCMRIAGKVQVATKYDPSNGHCYAYVAYQSPIYMSYYGQYHFKSFLKIVDITDESSPSIVNTWTSSDVVYDPSNDFEPTATANQFTNNIGFFFYRQLNGDPCTTVYSGYVDNHLNGSGKTSVGTISGPFPTIRFSGTGGLGDYVGIIKRGLPGGYLFPSWSEPWLAGSGANCVNCPGYGIYSKRVMGAQIYGP